LVENEVEQVLAYYCRYGQTLPPLGES